MPKQRSTRRAPAKARTPRTNAAGGGQGSGGSLPATAGTVVSGKRSTTRKLSGEENIAEQTKLARGLVLESWTGIVQGLIKKAKTGGYQQTKLLLDLCELANHGTPSDEEHTRQLCDALLEGMGFSSAQVEEQAAAIEEAQAVQEPEGETAL